MNSKFTISEVVKSSWEILKSQIWILLGLLIGYTIVSLILTFVLSFSSTLSSIVSAIINIVFTLGYTRNIFQAMDGEEPQFSAYGQESRKFVKAFAASFLCGVAVVIGLVLLILPGIYLALRLQFVIAIIVDEDAGIIESLQRSWDITKDDVLPLFLVALVAIGITFAGLLLLGIGILIATPLVRIIQLYVYRKLKASDSFDTPTKEVDTPANVIE